MGEVSQKCIKWLMFVFNFIFWICGLALIIAGGVAQTHYKAYSNFLDTSITVSAPVLLIIVGVFIFVIAFLGCCGAVRESYYMLMGFAVIVGIIFVVQLAGGIAGYVQKGKITSMADSLFPYYQKNYLNNSETREIVDSVQKELECCGSQNYADWFPYITKNVTEKNTTESFVAPTCCRKDLKCSESDLSNATLTKNCPLGAQSDCKIYTEGCTDKIENIIGIAISGVAGAAIGLAFVELIGIVFSCYLAKRIRSGYVYA